VRVFSLFIDRRVLVHKHDALGYFLYRKRGLTTITVVCRGVLLPSMGEEHLPYLKYRQQPRAEFQGRQISTVRVRVWIQHTTLRC
jgi:hypothetical protein